MGNSARRAARGERARAVCGEGGVERVVARWREIHNRGKPKDSGEREAAGAAGMVARSAAACGCGKGKRRGDRRCSTRAAVEAKRGRAAAAAARATMRVCGTVRGTLHARAE